VLDAMVNKVGLVMAPPRESSPKLPETPATKPEPAVPPAAAPPTTLVANVTGGTSSQAMQAAAPAAQAPAAAAAPAPADAERPVDRQTDKPPGEETSWSSPPPPLDAPPSSNVDQTIDVVVDEELLIADRHAPPTAPRIRAASPVDEEDTEVKPGAGGRRSERPPVRPTRR
jgi:hypothetical protein